MDLKACVFHFEWGEKSGIELYKAVAGSQLTRVHSFTDSDYRQRVSECIAFLDELKMKTVYTSGSIDESKFRFSSKNLRRSELTVEERAYFAEHGITVNSLETIS